MADIAMPASCRLCGAKFYGPKVAIIGRPHGRQQAFLQKLVDHFRDAHVQEGKGIDLASMEYRGMLLMLYFQIEDPDLAKMHDIARWNVHQKTLGARFTDQQIADMVEKIIPDIYTLVQMGDTVTLRKNLQGCFANLRDRLEEPGKYTPQAVAVDAN